MDGANWQRDFIAAAHRAAGRRQEHGRPGRNAGAADGGAGLVARRSFRNCSMADGNSLSVSSASSSLKLDCELGVGSTRLVSSLSDMVS